MSRWMLLGGFLLLPCTTIKASPITGLPACASMFDANCAAATTGGATLLLPGTGGLTTLYAVLNGGQTVFQQTYALPFADPFFQTAVPQADATLAAFAPFDPLPACSTPAQDNCIMSNPGGALIVTNSTSSSTRNMDTPVSQRVDQYQTTILASLNGNQTVFQQTFALPFSDPVVQAAVQQAQSILTADKAASDPPVLASNSVTLEGTQLSFVVTGQNPFPIAQTVTTTTVFSPAVIDVGDNHREVLTLLNGQTDINVDAANVFALDRDAITTSTFLTTQQYDLDGSTGPMSGVPEPGSWALTLAGLGFAGRLRKWRRRAL